MVTFEEFAKLEFRIAKILSVEKVEGADKLFKLIVELGTEQRTLVAGIAKSYSSDELVGKNIVVVANLEPRTLRGVTSQGMLLAAGETPDALVLLTTDRPCESGTKVG